MVRALTEHYGSPGRLADYRRQFERTVRRDGEDPLDFAVAIAVKAFGDMGPNARSCLIRDQFIVGHPDRDLWWHLDSVPPDTPIGDIVNRCRVWESQADTDARRVSKPTPEKVRRVCVVSETTFVPTEQVVAAVTSPSVRLADLETAQALPPH